MKKSAFTMIELVFVIVVLGIIASIAMGRMERDLRQEASETILSHIRLAQQLALSDDKHQSNNDANWYTRYWQMEYLSCDNGDVFYRVGSHRNHPNWGIDIKEESAIDPTDGKYIWSDSTCIPLTDTSNNVLLTQKFGITNINNIGGCSTVSDIGFDYLGRPYNGIATPTTADFSNIMTQDCNLTFTLSTDQDNDGSSDTFIITIEAETGHSFIVGQDNS
jgi:prepilin-type N-terminal cleavage/methylation domain-containing protein